MARTRSFGLYLISYQLANEIHAAASVARGIPVGVLEQIGQVTRLGVIRIDESALERIAKGYRTLRRGSAAHWLPYAVYFPSKKLVDSIP